MGNKACFYSKIGLCNPCPNEIKSPIDKKLYKKNIKQVISILNGNVKMIIRDLNRQLNILIKSNQFEEGIIIRNKIFRFDRLLNLKDDSDFFMNNNEKNLDEMLVILKLQ